jgi:prepilin-type N-terminal cleavage/methylation domain-containing protein/prepilin-type processing-associated H-X9-DG protein
MRRNLRNGFTLVELLVVIAIIGVLIGLLLPAVQAAREAARRMQCANNEKQIGLAILNYEAAFRTYPTTFTGNGSGTAPRGSGFYSWLSLILPFVEQAPLHQSINFSLPMNDAWQAVQPDYKVVLINNTHPNAMAASQIVPTYICPSDPYTMTDYIGSSRPAPGSYAGNVGWVRLTTGIVGNESPLQQSNGSMPIQNPRFTDAWFSTKIGNADMLDGTSHTALVGERMINSHVPVNGPFGLEMPASHFSTLSFCASSGSSRSLPQWIRYCESVSVPDPNYSAPHGKAWISGHTLAANLYMHVMTPNKRNCHIYGGEDRGNNVVSASSRHSGGVVNIVFADGHVSSIPATVDTKVWWAIGSRSGGESTTLED